MFIMILKRTIGLGAGIFILTLAFMYTAFLAPASAHGDEDQEATEKKEMGVEQMEQMVKVLQQLVTLLTQYKAQYGTYTPTPVYVAPATPTKAVEHHEEATEEDHEEVAETPTPVVVAKLVVELEEHSGKTHAHVRYVDGRPEAMFFVDVPLSNEEGVISAVSAQTGLSTGEVRGAIKYTGMQ